jgi:phosphinothricin acetyltransferase
MEETIRSAQEGDLPGLLAIYNAAIEQTTATCETEPRTLAERQAWWEAHLDPRYPLLVAEQDGDVLGYACLSVWAAGPVYAQTAEASLYLAPGAQGRGLGTRLMRALLAEARRIGHHVIVSRIWSQNGASLAMCRKCGYETIGVQKEVGRRHGAWEDCEILQVIL